MISARMHAPAVCINEALTIGMDTRVKPEYDGKGKLKPELFFVIHFHCFINGI